MPAILAIIFAFFIGFYLSLRGIHPLLALLLASCVVPFFVLFAEFVLPYMGGGASMWPIALMFGGCYGFASGGLGVLIALAVIKIKKRKSKADT
jgi:hypothetical protein